jgi:hypothetical protein
VVCTMTVGQSKATVTISLDALPASVREGARSLIRFDCEVDWHEDHRFLKFELPTTVWAPEATYDAAFGVVKRPTYRNTTWDSAKFEVCAHKFADREFVLRLTGAHTQSPSTGMVSPFLTIASTDMPCRAVSCDSPSSALPRLRTRPATGGTSNSHLRSTLISVLTPRAMCSKLLTYLTTLFSVRCSG